MSWFSSASFSDFASKSKIPPQLIAACFQIGDVVGDGVDAFGFHGRLLKSESGELYLPPQVDPRFGGRSSDGDSLEARPGIEPRYTALQSESILLYQ